MLKRLRNTGVCWFLITGIFLQTACAEQSLGGYYRPKHDLNSERSVYLPPLLSFIVPGFDQWVEGQFSAALPYTLTGAGGFLLSRVGARNADNRYKDFGMQLYFSAGAMSLFHSFRTAVSTRKAAGDYSFLGKDESPNELMLAPFHFSYLGNWTTLFPLISGLAIFFLLSPTGSSPTPATFGDLFYASGISYMSGISEELLFRGYLMPVLYQSTGDATLSIAVSGGAYALAHGLRFNHFITALAFGLYSGWVVQDQDWSVKEMIFVHTWFDIMAFLSDFAAHREHAFLRIPPIQIRF